MPKSTIAIQQLPPATRRSLQKLAADLAVARLRRREPLRTCAKRLGVTVSTLQRLEAGDPSVSVGILASALWLIRRDAELGNLAASELDRGAIEMSVREAVELGTARAQSSAEAETSRLESRSVLGGAEPAGAALRASAHASRKD